jgi:hypothetical protein
VVLTSGCERKSKQQRQKLFPRRNHFASGFFKSSAFGVWSARRFRAAKGAFGSLRIAPFAAIDVSKRARQFLKSA